MLIVDDDKASGQMLAEVVKRLGFKPVLTNKTADALNVVRLQTVHAAIVDVLLPKVSGVDLVQEFRRTKFAENPVVFVSGVFKDKVFAQDTIKKTNAVDFLFKPFGVDELTESLKKALGALLSAEKLNAQSLLTRRFNQPRERAKVIEHLEPIKGAEFPFVLSFLLNAGVSGHLNIVNDTGEIFGVTVIKGAVTEVDSAESQSTGVLALIANGFLAQEDWDDYQVNGNKRFPLERLVDEGLVSPHAVLVARREQIISDFKSICSADVLQLNFVPQEEGEEPPKHAVRMDELFKVFSASLQDFFPPEYLAAFYTGVVKFPVNSGEKPEMLDAVLELPVFADVTDLKVQIQKGATLEQLLSQAPGQQTEIYQAVHLMVLADAITFNDMSRAKDLTSTLERYKKLWAEIQNKTPDKIFEYFGASPNASATVLNNIFDEYVRSNNPEHLPKEASAELKDLCKKCFDLVKKAHGIMTDDSQRVMLFEDLKRQNAEKVKLSNKLAAESLDLLRKGQFQPAFEKAKEAEQAHPTTLQFLILVWAEVKAGAHSNKPRLQDIQKKLESLPPDDRKSAYYFMALGLVKKYLGDPTAAGYFEKALQMDSLFVEARRELNAISQVQPKKEKLDIFTGDITEIVSQLFKRKAD